MLIFRDYDQAALELQYSGSKREPHLSAEKEAYAADTEARSSKIRKGAPGKRDIAYGPHPRELIDVFAADKRGGPLLVFIHGGYWRMNTKNEHAWIAPAFTSRGVAVATINYPLCPDVRIGDIVASCRRALLHLHNNAASLGFDPARIHVAGHSAGGHLTAMLACTDFAAHGGPADLVRSGTCISGLYDLVPLQKIQMNADLRISDDDVRTLSPLTMKPCAGTSINLTVGSLEGAEFLRNTAELGEAWQRLGADVTIVPAPGRYHFNVLDDLATPGQPIFERLMTVMAA